MYCTITGTAKFFWSTIPVAGWRLEERAAGFAGRGGRGKDEEQKRTEDPLSASPLPPFNFLYILFLFLLRGRRRRRRREKPARYGNKSSLRERERTLQVQQTLLICKHPWDQSGVFFYPEQLPSLSTCSCM